jgi:hypothetical protein
MQISEILQDFRRRWENSFVFVEHPDSGEESLFFVDRITDDRNKIATMELSSPEYGKILLNMGTAHTLKFKYPPVGVFQNGQDAYVFRRVPAKQYKHGIYYGNATTAPVFNAMLGRSVRAPREQQLKFDDVLAAFRGERYTYADALKMLGSGKFRSVALQRDWSLCLSPTEKEAYVLLYWETPVATVDNGGKVTTLHEKQFEAVIQQVQES